MIVDLGMTDSIEAAGERLFIEDFDTWDMTGYYLYSKLLRSGVSGHIGTWGCPSRVASAEIRPALAHTIWRAVMDLICISGTTSRAKCIRCMCPPSKARRSRRRRAPGGASRRLALRSRRITAHSYYARWSARSNFPESSVRAAQEAPSDRAVARATVLRRGPHRGGSRPTLGRLDAPGR